MTSALPPIALTSKVGPVFLTNATGRDKKKKLLTYSWTACLQVITRTKDAVLSAERDPIGRMGQPWHDRVLHGHRLGCRSFGVPVHRRNDSALRL